MRTVVYKGLLLADQVGRYYRDLADTLATTHAAQHALYVVPGSLTPWFCARPGKFGPARLHRSYAAGFVISSDVK